MRRFLIRLFRLTCATLLLMPLSASSQTTAPGWRHLSSADGTLPVPNGGNQQTSSAVFDVDRDGVQDFAITERTEAPSVTWCRRTGAGWTRYVIDDEPLRIEAGSVARASAF